MASSPSYRRHGSTSPIKGFKPRCFHHIHHPFTQQFLGVPYDPRLEAVPLVSQVARYFPMLLSFAPNTKLNVSNGLIHHFLGNSFELQFLNVPSQSDGHWKKLDWYLKFVLFYVCLINSIWHAQCRCNLFLESRGVPQLAGRVSIFFWNPHTLPILNPPLCITPWSLT